MLAPKSAALLLRLRLCELLGVTGAGKEVMDFMDLLREWLDLRDADLCVEDRRPVWNRQMDRERMRELEKKLNQIAELGVTPNV